MSNPDDVFIASAARNMAAMWSHTALACGGRVERWPEGVAADAGAPNVVLNRTTMLERTIDPETLIKRAEAFYALDTPWGIVDPWGDLDLSPSGLRVITAMPCMVLPPRSTRPPLPHGLRIEPVTGDTALRDLERVLFTGFTMVRWPDPPLFGPSFASGPCIPWVAYEEERPVACSVSLIGEEAVGVYLVATVPDRRGKGFGEAVSWAAATARPSLPALLQASVMGEPVYRRMGFRAVGRCVFWVPTV